MNFKLLKKKSDRVKATYHIVDAANGDIHGSVSVPLGQAEADLLRCWSGPKSAPGSTSSSPQSGRRTMAESLVASLRRQPFNKGQILRG